MYISDDQLALPEEYADVPKFPDKFPVDGYILCMDVSTPPEPSSDSMTRIFQAVQQTKKPFVVALTKYDIADETAVANVLEIISKAKKQVHFVEVSGQRNLNVDVCFLVLCHLIDAKKPKTKVTPYAEAKTHLDDRIRKIEESFQNLLDREVKDFSQNVFQVCEGLKEQMEYQVLIELKGLDRLQRLVRGQLAFLRKQQIEAKLTRYVELLPLILDALIPRLSLNDTTDSCASMLRANAKFGQYFVESRGDWQEDNDVLGSSNKDTVPFGLLAEDIGLEVLRNHINKVWCNCQAAIGAWLILRCNACIHE